LARVGRVIFLVMLMWVMGLVLAGVGVLPAGDLPLGTAVAGEDGPVALRALPRGAPPSRSDLLPARALARTPAGRAAALSHSAPLARQRNTAPGAFAGRGHLAPTGGGVGAARRGAEPGPSASPGRGHGAGGSSASAGMVVGNSGAAVSPAAAGAGATVRRHAPATPHSSAPPGRSGLAPGRVRQSSTAPATSSSTSTTPGSSGSAPGRASPRGHRYGNGG
jgi:hypothetical protein